MSVDAPAAGAAGRLLMLALLAAIAAFAALYLSAIGPYWNISPDSAGYVMSARSFAAGNGLGPAYVHPPMAALVFGLVLRFAPDGYTALNATTTLLLLAALALAGRLLALEAGRIRALAAVLATLAFNRFFIESTNLLSEPVYMILSVSALLLMRGRAPLPEAPRRQHRLRQALAGAVLVLTVLTRTIGLTLAAAAMLVELHGRIGGRRPVRPVLLAGAALAIAVVVARDVLLAAGDGTGVFQGWLAEGMFGGTAATPGILAAAREAAAHLGAEIGSATAAGGVLLGAASTGSRIADALLMAGGTALVLTGLVAALRHRVRVLPLYVLLYLLVVMVHVVKGGYGPSYRLLVPVVPFLFHYGAEGVLACAAPIAARLPGLRLSRLLAVAGVLYIAALARHGWHDARWLARDQHQSPLGAYPIRRHQNYDVQRLAMRLGSLARPGDAYAAVQITMHDVLTGRRGHDLLNAPSASPDAVADWLRQRRIRYLLLDRMIPAAVARAGPFIERYHRSLRLVEELPGAALYEVAWP